MSLSHLEALPGGGHISPESAVNAPPGVLLYARYDLAGIKEKLSVEDIARGPSSLWRYAPLLPVRDPANVVTLRSGTSTHTSTCSRSGAVSRSRPMASR